MSEPATKPNRLTISRALELALTKPAATGGVTLTRNAKGETQVSVDARVEHGKTLADAADEATIVYDHLCGLYGVGDSDEGASVTLSRNAKGETQIEVVARGDGEPEQVAAAARVEYDRLRTAYPLSTGYAGATPAKDK